MSLRRCLREPIPEIEIAANRLADAASAHMRGERDVAEALLVQADDKIVRDWLYSVWGRARVYNRPIKLLANPPELPMDQRGKPRDATNETKRLIHRRDGYYCRFCKIPVIRGALRSAIHTNYPKAVPWGSTNDSQHAAFQCMWAQYDHILPHQRGGLSNLENVYLTCAACNYGRGAHLLDELDLIHPSLHDPRQGNWNGLESFR
jgi:hypothetical protein